MEMHQVHEYLNSSISKVSTILKWQMTTMLKRKLLEMQRVRGARAGPAGAAAAGPMLEAKLMNLIKAGCRSSDSAIILV